MGVGTEIGKTRAVRPYFIPFQNLVLEDFSLVGGKALTLGRLLQAGIQVPEGAALTRRPSSPEDWQILIQWWKSIGSPPLAVRSSGLAEDSQELSFAGQHQTVLGVQSEDELRRALEVCFGSVGSLASQAYRAELADSKKESGIGVALQRMVDARQAGVLFTRDPRQPSLNRGLIEVVDGLGESLVSGRQTPRQIQEGAMDAPSWAQELFVIGKRIAELFSYDADIEWAIDAQERLWILQSRPITTLGEKEGRVQAQAQELKRLQVMFPSETLWDGQTFAEWTGSATPLSFEIWHNALTPAGALGKALSDLGYVGQRSQDLLPKQSVLDRVFGRAYVNLTQMEKLYFGATPYEMEARPRPHLVFRFRKLGVRELLNFFSGSARMFRVAWRLSTQRREIIRDAERALLKFERLHRLPMNPEIYKSWDAPSLVSRFESLAHEFSHQVLVEPLKVMVAAESTLQSLTRSVGEKTLGEWMSTRMRLSSVAMAEEFRRAQEQSQLQAAFLAAHGHRCPGELDLSSPRWLELGPSAFGSGDLGKAPGTPNGARVESPRQSRASSPQSGLLQSINEAEWEILVSLMELREHWKDSLLKFYAHLRWVALELGRKTGLGEKIFWLRGREIREVVQGTPVRALALARVADRRKQEWSWLSSAALPQVFRLQDLDIRAEHEHRGVEPGDGVSGGIAYGVIRKVSDPTQIDWDNWPEQAVIVAEAMDPGWTPLFARSRAVITERGGALSHCAIVAREMGIPVVSGISNCMNRFEENEHVWVDGSTGNVTRA